MGMSLSVSVHHTLDDLESDLKTISRRAPRDMAKIVAKNAKEGNRIAKANASEQHTMFGDADIEYAPSFTAERVSPLVWVYGPEDSRGDGTQAKGYELGSRNSPPHFDLLRSQDHIGPAFQRDVRRLVDDLFWPES